MEVFTDGACSGNPGPGGWGWVTRDGREGSGGAAETTNQRMELEAVLRALRALDGPVDVHSDSTYVVNCFRDGWYEGWLKRGWRNANKKPVANRDLWEPLIDLYLRRADEIDFTWVKGHSGNELNERADQLAVAAASEQKRALASVDVEGIDDADAFDGVEPTWPTDRAIWVVGATTLDSDQIEALDAHVAGFDPSRDVVVSGLRRGAELLTAERALHRGVALAVVLPFDEPAGGWEAEDRARFDSALGRAQWVVTLPGDRSQPGKAVEDRNSWVRRHVIGAIVIGDGGLARELDAVGLSTLTG